MTAQEILDEIRPLAKDSYKKVLLQHGIPEPVLGVKIEDMKKIVKRVKKDHQLALDLWATGVYDAMYLAGLIADDDRMTKTDLRHWVDTAKSPPLCGYTVAWVAGTGPITAAHLDAAPRLRVIARYGVGVEAVDVDAATRRGG